MLQRKPHEASPAREMQALLARVAVQGLCGPAHHDDHRMSGPRLEQEVQGPLADWHHPWKGTRRDLSLEGGKGASMHNSSAPLHGGWIPHPAWANQGQAGHLEPSLPSASQLRELLTSPSPPQGDFRLVFPNTDILVKSRRSQGGGRILS